MENGYTTAKGYKKGKQPEACASCRFCENSRGEDCAVCRKHKIRTYAAGSCGDYDRKYGFYEAASA